MALHQIIQHSLYLEVFYFKLCAAWTDRLENYISGAQKHNKHNLHVYILYTNVIISYFFRDCKNESQHVDGWRVPSLFIITNVSRTAAAIGWTIPCDSTEIAEHIVQRYSNQYNHSADPKRGMWINIVSFFYTIEMPMYFIGYLMITKICTYISLSIRNMTISVNKKLVCIFPHQLENTCDLHLVKSLQYYVVNCACILHHFKHNISVLEDH